MVRCRRGYLNGALWLTESVVAMQQRLLHVTHRATLPKFMVAKSAVFGAFGAGNKKNCALSEARTHDLWIVLITQITGKL